MAVTSLAYSVSDYRTAAAMRFYGLDYSSLTAADAATIDRLVRRTESLVWSHPPVDPPHVWSACHQSGTVDIWPDVAVAAATTVSGGAYSGGATTITATAASFYESMIGKSIVITTIGTFVIASYTSSTVISVTGDASTAVAKTFSIASGGSFTMASDFESIETDSMVIGGSAGYPDVQLVQEKIILHKRAQNSSTGYPQLGVIRWKESDGTASQVYEFLPYPLPGSRYELQFPCKVNPVGMSTANPYPRGGVMMADLLMVALIAVIEEEKTRVRGDAWQHFVTQCGIAAERDRNRNTNRVLGAMRSDGMSVPLEFDVKSLILTTN